MRDWQPHDAIKSGNQTNTISLRCSGTEIQARINDASAGSIRGDDYKDGRFYIGMDQMPGLEADVRFDDLALRSP